MVIIAFDDTEKTAFNLSKELAIAQYTFNLSKELAIAQYTFNLSKELAIAQYTFNLSKELAIAQYSVHNICVLNFISDIIELKKTPR